MVLSIEQDWSRFRQIVKGKIRKELKKYISHDALLGKQGKNIVKIPVPQIEIPSFQFDTRNVGGVGQGEGEVGTVLGKGDEESGQGGAGNQPGGHVMEVEVSLEELAAIIGEELELPRILPKGERDIVTEKAKYTGINKTGPESLRHFKRTFKQALKRQIITGIYDPKNPIVIPYPEDKRYRSFKVKPSPFSRAVIILMMDVSGSIGQEEREIVRLETFWIDTWLKHNYKGITTRYIVHDARAHEVDRETFFHLGTAGGTMISSAYQLCSDLIEKDYDPNQWNIYAFHFSDGDNWSRDDTEKCINLLTDKLLTKVNLFGYCQVEKGHLDGRFIHDLNESLANADNMVLSSLKEKEEIYDSLKDLFGKGK